MSDDYSVTLTASQWKELIAERDALADERDALKALIKLPDNYCLSCGGTGGHDEGCRGTTPLLALSAENGAIKARLDEVVAYGNELDTALREARARLAEAERDADRYRWLREENHAFDWDGFPWPKGFTWDDDVDMCVNLDRAIDIARAADSADDVTCSHCGLGEQFDGVWHKPDCPTLNHPIQKPSPAMTGVGDGEGNAPKNSC